MTTTFHRVAALVVSGAMACTLSACGGDEATPAATPSATASAPTPEELATEAYEAYWAAYVQMSNSGDVAPSYYDGIAKGSFVETDLKRLGDQAESGVVRVGEPTFSDYKTVVDGDKATSLVCFDESKWGAKADGEVVDGSTDGAPNPLPQLATLVYADGAWIVTGRTLAKEEPCP